MFNLFSKIINRNEPKRKLYVKTLKEKAEQCFILQVVKSLGRRVIKFHSPTTLNSKENTIKSILHPQ